MHRACWFATIAMGGALFVAALPVAAHHSSAMYDLTTSQSIDGTVKQFQWTNPHAWIYVSVPAADGKVTDYSIELTSPNLLMRRGWRPSTLKTGDKVTVVLNPLRDGSPGGRIVSVTMPDGKVLTER